MNSLKGQFLISSPDMRDPNFHRTVVLMIQHDEQGALGVIINRPLETTIAEAWEQVSQTPCEIPGALHQGGPCEGPVMAVHTFLLAGEVEIAPGIYFSTNRDNLERLVNENHSPIKLFVGYSGWSPGQLEAELELGGWIIAPSTSTAIFDDNDNVWDELVRLHAEPGLPPLNPKVVPEDPSYN